MIKDRPKLLTSQPDHGALPQGAFAIDWATLPDRVQLMILPLGGVQPITKAMCEAAGEDLKDKPSPGEVELFRHLGTRFQMIAVVMNLAAIMQVDGVPTGTPYSISMIPAQKRGRVETVSIDVIDQINPNLMVAHNSCYRGYDPFSGGWSLFGPAGVVLPPGGKGHIDEIGIVVEQYFLATAYDPADVLHTPGGFGSPEVEARYDRHRMRRLFKPLARCRLGGRRRRNHRGRHVLPRPAPRCLLRFRAMAQGAPECAQGRSD